MSRMYELKELAWNFTSGLPHRFCSYRMNFSFLLGLSFLEYNVDRSNSNCIGAVFYFYSPQFLYLLMSSVLSDYLSLFRSLPVIIGRVLLFVYQSLLESFPFLNLEIKQQLHIHLIE